MNTKIAKSVTDYVDLSSQALAVASRMLQKSASEKQSATEKVAGIVSLLSQAKLIDANDEKAAATQLTNHADALDILSNVLQLYKEATVKAAQAAASLNMGSGVPDDTAGGSRRKYATHNETRGGYNSELPESDRRLLQAAGVQV